MIELFNMECIPHSIHLYLHPFQEENIMKQLYQFSAILIGTIAAIVIVSLTGAGQRPALAMPPSPDSLSRSLVADDTECDNTRTVQVSGAAAINVRPDRALIQLGVESTADTPEQVQANNNIAIQKIVAAIRTFGVAEKDIATDHQPDR
jgi:uncharacterized protein YggE